MPMKQPELAKFAKRIRALRGTLTQAQAAQRAGCSERTWQNYERQLTKPRPDQIRFIAGAFGPSDPKAMFEELHSLAYGPMLELEDRFTDAELDRLAARLAPFLAEYLTRIQEQRK